LLIASAVIVPAALFASAAWQSRADALRKGEGEIVHSIAELRDSVHMTLDAEKRTLISVEDHIRRMTWAEIADPDTSAFLHHLASTMEGIEAIWIADPDGYVRAASEPWGQGVRVPEQEFFTARHDDKTGVYLSTLIQGGTPSISSVELVLSRVSSDGAFNGTIHAALSAAYFADYFQTTTPASNHAAMVRDDGLVLADDATIPDYYLNPHTPLMQHIAEQPTGRMLADRETLYSYLQVPGFPVYISVGANKSAILQRWYDGLALYGATALIAAMALMTISLIAVRRSNAVQAALTQLNVETEKRLETERRLRASQRMESVGQLTAGIAHDFNNLLAVILGSLELLITHAKGHERIQQMAERARRAGERGARLVSALLTFAGRQALEVRTLNLNPVIRDLLPLAEQAVGKEIRIELVLNPALQECRADLDQLESALLNLAVNARDAMPKGGTLTILTRNTQRAVSDIGDSNEPIAGPWVAVAVQDMGSGMTEEVKARIFEPFFTTKGVGEGSGLGLCQVLGFVRQVGGHVAVDSVLEHGTTVTLYFPQIDADGWRPAGHND
jgi:signal transduction histidine kinase